MFWGQGGQGWNLPGQLRASTHSWSRDLVIRRLLFCAHPGLFSLPLFHSGVPTAAAARPPRARGEEAGGHGRPPPPAGRALCPQATALCPLPSPLLCCVSAMLSRHARPTLTCVLSVLWWGLLCHAPLPDLLYVPQEASQPLNLTAKPKAPELPNTSSSPSLKLGTCGPRPPSHGAAPRDRPPSPPSLPLGKLSAPCLVASSWGESTRGPDLGQHVLSLSGF